MACVPYMVYLKMSIRCQCICVQDLGLRTGNALENKSLYFQYLELAGKMCIQNNGYSVLNLNYSSSFLLMLN